MITIYKDDHRLSVSKSAYESIFKPQGWQPVKAHKNLHMELPNNPALPEEGFEDLEEEEVEEDYEDTDLSERPLSSLNMEELRVLAAQYDIDTSSMRSKKEIRIAIKMHMED